MSMSGAGSEKGLPKKPRKEATTSPHPEPTEKLGTENDPQLREGVWAALAPGTSTGAGATFSTPPKNVPARAHWMRLQPSAPGGVGRLA